MIGFNRKCKGAGGFRASACWQWAGCRMSIDQTKRRAALESRSPWRMNPACLTPKAIKALKDYEANPNARRKAAMQVNKESK